MPINNPRMKELDNEEKVVNEEESEVSERTKGFSDIGGPRVGDDSEISLDDMVDDDGDGEIKKKGLPKPVLIAGAVVVVLVVVLFVANQILAANARDRAIAENNRILEEQQAAAAQTTEVTTTEATTVAVEEDSGVVNLDEDGVSTEDAASQEVDSSMYNLTKPRDPGLYLKDLSGLTVNAQYLVSNVETRRDYVNYRKMRGQIGVGLELLWLDVTYKERSYVIQIPFVDFKDLDDEGIVPVDMEVLHIENETNDGTNERLIISGMKLADGFRDMRNMPEGG